AETVVSHHILELARRVLSPASQRPEDEAERPDVANATTVETKGPQAFASPTVKPVNSREETH
ncbi:MAG: hypothetical protein ACP5JG_16545, partial [Anaerolineae bacterium]